jgi:hypothetical protein
MTGHETPENHPLTILKGFSTVSEEVTKLDTVCKAKFGKMVIRDRNMEVSSEY